MPTLTAEQVPNFGSGHRIVDIAKAGDSLYVWTKNSDNTGNELWDVEADTGTFTQVLDSNDAPVSPENIYVVGDVLIYAIDAGGGTREFFKIDGNSNITQIYTANNIEAIYSSSVFGDTLFIGMKNKSFQDIKISIDTSQNSGSILDTDSYTFFLAAGNHAFFFNNESFWDTSDPGIRIKRTLFDGSNPTEITVAPGDIGEGAPALERIETTGVVAINNKIYVHITGKVAGWDYEYLPYIMVLNNEGTLINSYAWAPNSESGRIWASENYLFV